VSDFKVHWQGFVLIATLMFLTAIELFLTAIFGGLFK